MKDFENQSVPTDEEHDLSIKKLTKINGIATKTAQAMYEVGIRSYADLIEYLEQHTDQEFSTALKEHGVNRRPGLINREMWIKQAEMLERSEKNTIPSHYEVVQAEEAAKASQSSRKEKEHDAMFTVSFDTTINDAGERVLSTTVYNESNGGEEFVFQGTDTALWVDWILERANLPFVMTSGALKNKISQEMHPGEAKVPMPAIPGELKDFVLEIDDVQVSVTNSELPASNTRLRAEINIKLSGSDAERLTEQAIAFRTEMYLLNLDNGFPAQVGSSEDQFKPHNFRYSYQFEVTMPAVGRYELHSTVHLLPLGELKAYHQGPILKVTP